MASLVKHEAGPQKTVVTSRQLLAAALTAAPAKGIGVKAALLQISPISCGDPESSVTARLSLCSSAIMGN